jgi:ABC-type sugar transport system ATPase subunit
MRVVDNMFAGKELRRHGMIDRKAQYRRAKDILERLQQDIDPNEMMRNLRVGQQQVVEIAKTMLQQKLHVLIMDEPTSSLSGAEVEVLFKLIEDLKCQGIALIYISHRLEEIMRIGDRITVLRDGSKIDEADVADIDVPWIVQRMVGHSNLNIERTPYLGASTPLLEVRDYTLPRLGGGYTVDHVSFTLHKGEVLGLYGLMGAGRTELVECIMGLHPESRGMLMIDGEEVQRPTVSNQIARGLVLMPEDRQKDGLVQTLSIASNLLLTCIPRLTKPKHVIDDRACKRAVNETVRNLQIKTTDTRHPITALSGGNQQKVVIGKCVLADAKIFMMDEPSRGIDVGAKNDIFSLMRRFAAEGKGVLFIGSELKEILSVCDRVLVLSGGKLTADLFGGALTEEALVTASSANLTTGKINATSGAPMITQVQGGPAQ